MITKKEAREILKAGGHVVRLDYYDDEKDEMVCEYYDLDSEEAEKNGLRRMMMGDAGKPL